LLGLGFALHPRLIPVCYSVIGPMRVS